MTQDGHNRYSFDDFSLEEELKVSDFDHDEVDLEDASAVRSRFKVKSPKKEHHKLKLPQKIEKPQLKVPESKPEISNSSLKAHK